MTFGISAIVTGAASGLGRATAAKLASRGAGVVIFDLPNSDGAAVASELGEKVLFCPGDVTNPQDAQNAAEMAMKEFGSLQGKSCKIFFFSFKPGNEIHYDVPPSGNIIQREFFPRNRH